MGSRFRKWILLVSFVFCFDHSNAISPAVETSILKPNLMKQYKITKGQIKIFCRDGEEKLISSIWRSAQITIGNNGPSDFEVFRGENQSDILSQYHDSQSIFHLLPWKSNKISLPIFNNSCVGITANDIVVSVILEITRIDFWKVFRLIFGIILFFYATNFSRNSLFYYSSGVGFGVLASLLIVIFIFSRYVPKKFGAVSFMIGGWAFVLYLFQLLYVNLRSVVTSYRNLVIGYFVVVGAFSFAVCYYYGPLKDARTLSLVQWALQIVALLMVFYSTEWQEIAMAIILVMFALYNFPAAWISKIKTYWRRRFPPKIKLLNEDEYHQQGAEYTQKQLDELRSFCSSPDCKSWKLFRKLKSPIRFADFVLGNSHLSDEEILNYETEVSYGQLSGAEFTEDDSEDEMI